MLPCSCGALCVVNDTCCENLSQDCPHILQDARYEFGDLITSDKFCDVDNIAVTSLEVSYLLIGEFISGACMQIKSFLSRIDTKYCIAAAPLSRENP
ncbi:hypothetical protein RRG08_064515 [Elysia crispata]|uniref:Uncharacterized protein n=1 Tax=Elysia crispata TaxID=231223 RepID=A0AAE0Y8R4_9GAST|nr:hypothetical protein RRG08_064515 [Elysia crispata]